MVKVLRPFVAPRFKAPMVAAAPVVVEVGPPPLWAGALEVGFVVAGLRLWTRLAVVVVPTPLLGLIKVST